MDKVRVGVIGCGYWGPNHIRNFSALRDVGAEMVVAADTDPGKRAHVQSLYPWVRTVSSGESVIDGDEVDAVVIATPVGSHYKLALRALDAGKHVLVEKPFVTDVREADELVGLAQRRRRVLMVGHTFEYTATVNRIRDIVAAGDIGDVLYIRSLRLNLGLFQTDINVIWDLAPHDISILLYVLGEMPRAVSAVGRAHVIQGIEDIATINLEFGDAMMATVIVSWLDPRKVREMTIVGDRKMLVYDDVSSNEKIKIYDKGVDGPQDYDTFGEFQYAYRYGDIVTPMIREYEPLKAECMHFVECIRRGTTPRSSGEIGARVTRVLSAANQSLREGGRRTVLGE